jgi:nucleotide-binding universal stress UspA family protein
MCIYSIAVDGGRASVINTLTRSFGVFKRILLAYDGSQHARKALEVAVDLAKKYGARLYIVEVIDTATAFWGPGTHVPFDAIESMRRKAEADIAEAKARAESGASRSSRRSLREIRQLLWWSMPIGKALIL